jgi:hypothetical protein
MKDVGRSRRPALVVMRIRSAEQYTWEQGQGRGARDGSLSALEPGEQS